MDNKLIGFNVEGADDDPDACINITFYRDFINNAVVS